MSKRNQRNTKIYEITLEYTLENLHREPDVNIDLQYSKILKEKLEILFNTKFTNSEIKILQYYAEGFNASQIAQIMYRSQKTIDTHRKNIMEKFNIKSYTKFVAICTRMTMLVRSNSQERIC